MGSILVVTLDTCAVHFIDAEFGLDARPPIMTHETIDHIKKPENNYLLLYSTNGFIQVLDISDFLKITTVFTKRFIRPFIETDDLDITYELNTYTLSLVVKSASCWAVWSTLQNTWIAICNENNPFFDTNIEAQTIAEIENSFVACLLNCIPEGIYNLFGQLIKSYLHTNKAKALNLFKQIFQRQAEGCKLIGNADIMRLLNESIKFVEENFPSLMEEILAIKDQYKEERPHSRDLSPMVGEKERGPLIVYEKDEYYIDDDEIAKRTRQKPVTFPEAIQLQQLQKFQGVVAAVQYLFESSNAEEFNQRLQPIRDIDYRDALGVMNAANIVPPEHREALAAYNNGLRMVELQQIMATMVRNFPAADSMHALAMARQYEYQQSLVRQTNVMRLMEQKWRAALSERIPPEEVKPAADGNHQPISATELFQQQKSQEYYRQMQLYYQLQHQMQQAQQMAAFSRFMMKMQGSNMAGEAQSEMPMPQPQQPLAPKRIVINAQHAPAAAQDAETAPSDRPETIAQQDEETPKPPASRQFPSQQMHQQLISQFFKKSRERGEEEEKAAAEPTVFTLPIIDKEADSDN